VHRAALPWLRSGFVWTTLPYRCRKQSDHRTRVRPGSLARAVQAGGSTRLRMDPLSSASERPNRGRLAGASEPRCRALLPRQLAHQQRPQAPQPDQSDRVNGANSGMVLSRIHLTRVSSDSGMVKYPSVLATLIAMAAVPLTSTLTSFSFGSRSWKPNLAISAPFSRKPALSCLNGFSARRDDATRVHDAMTDRYECPVLVRVLQTADLQMDF
jgi:hypothetical protein